MKDVDDLTKSIHPIRACVTTHQTYPRPYASQILYEMYGYGVNGNFGWSGPHARLANSVAAAARAAPGGSG